MSARATIGEVISQHGDRWNSRPPRRARNQGEQSSVSNRHRGGDQERFRHAVHLEHPGLRRVRSTRGRSEFTADVGIKKGEKVDYALCVTPSADPHRMQGVDRCPKIDTRRNCSGTSPPRTPYRRLTNGVIWQFFTDLDAPNKMDAKPFPRLDLLDIDDTLIPEVQKLSKDNFDLDSIISAAEELKYVGALKREIAGQSANRVTNGQVLHPAGYEGAYTAKVREQFTSLVTKASRQFLTESVNDRLKTALGAGAGSPSRCRATRPPRFERARGAGGLERDTEIETTLEELEAIRSSRPSHAERLAAPRHAPRRQELLRRAARRQQPKADRPPAFQWTTEISGPPGRQKVETRHASTSSMKSTSTRTLFARLSSVIDDVSTLCVAHSSCGKSSTEQCAAWRSR